MSEHFTFDDGKAIVVTDGCLDGNVVWSDNNLNYTVESDTSLGETINETFVTAVGDSTQYMSVLDNTGDDTLQCLSEFSGLENTKMNSVQTVTGDEAAGSIEMDGQQVVIFSMEGSDDLYGIQIAEDEDGNVQKYQFKFRTNEEGQLEAIPETIQILNNEIETSEEIPEPTETEEGEQQQQRNLTIFVSEDNSQEHILPDEPTEEVVSNEEVDEIVEEPPAQSLTYEEIIDNKAGIIEEIQIETTNVKDEIIDEVRYESVYEDRDIQENDLNISEDDQILEYEEEYLDGEEIELQQPNGKNEQLIIKSANSKELIKQENHYEAVYVQETISNNLDDNSTENVAVTNENESETEEYDMVAGVHITADIVDDENSQPTIINQTDNTVLQEVIEKANFKIIEKNQPLKLLQDESKTIMYYVLPEKENVNSFQAPPQINSVQFVKSNEKIGANPRSILKSSFPPTNNVVKENKIVENEEDSINNRRFSRSKQAIQARQFQNFLSKTTIVHAPMRQQRLPRKQQIKPVNERVDEEIIVQEVMYSAGGFVENSPNAKLPADAYVEFIELSDDASDEEYNPKKNGTKKLRNRRSKLSQKTDETSDDSDFSVIEINSDDDEDKIEINSSKRGRGRPRKDSVKITPQLDTSMKRRRGRPPKHPLTDAIESSEELSSPSKKSRTDSSDSGKTEAKCPHCPKTFPSENSLNTHIQHHNLENSLRTKVKPKFEYKHKCEKCEQTFKNVVLLNKHVCPKNKNTKLVMCNICRKSIESSKLDAHKRMHAKSQLLNSTNITKISAKKFLSPRPKITVTKPLNKCNQCPRTFTVISALNNHMKTHEQFICKSCQTSFKSRILLDSHVRTSCVKQKPAALLTSKQSTPRQSFLLKVKCELCDMQFSGFENLFKHKVAKHGEFTPIKNDIKEKQKKNVPGKEEFCGIRPSRKFQKAIAKIRQRVAESVDKT